MNHIITNIRALCRTWKPQWQGMVMAELVYRRGESSGIPAVEVREGRVIRLTTRYDHSMEGLSIVLFPFKASKPKAMTPWEGDDSISFSEERVHQDSTLLGDHNEIHQGENPVVSGFEILLEMEPYFSEKSIKIRFYAPARAGDSIFLHQEKGKITGYTDHLCFICEEIL